MREIKCGMNNATTLKSDFKGMHEKTAHNLEGTGRERRRCNVGRTHLGRRIVVVGVEGVDGDDDLSDGAGRVGGRGIEGARNEGWTFHEPHCSVRFGGVDMAIHGVALLDAVVVGVSLLLHRRERVWSLLC